eukprot:6420007-Prymnesium_polylepis.1
MADKIQQRDVAALRRFGFDGLKLECAPADQTRVLSIRPVPLLSSRASTSRAQFVLAMEQPDQVERAAPCERLFSGARGELPPGRPRPGLAA